MTEASLRRPLEVREVAARDAWDALLLRLPDPDVRQAFAWGQIRSGHHGHAYRYAAFAGDAPVAAMSVIPWTLAPGASLLYASRGPVVDPAAGEAAWQGVLAIARVIGRRSRGIVLRMSPGVMRDQSPLHDELTARGVRALPDEWTSWNAPRISMTLDLTASETDVKRRMRESTRLSLTRAAKHGVKIADELDDGALARFHQMLALSGRRRAFPVRPLEYFRALRDAYVARGAGCLLMANHDGHDLGGLLAVRFGRRGYLLHSCLDAESEEVRKLRVGAGLHWEVIRWARAHGCTAMDWGGAGTGYPPRPEHVGYGIYDFKHGFGCRLEHYSGYYDIVFRPALYRLFRLAERHAVGWAWRIRSMLN